MKIVILEPKTLVTSVFQKMPQWLGWYPGCEIHPLNDTSPLSVPDRMVGEAPAWVVKTIFCCLPTPPVVINLVGVPVAPASILLVTVTMVGVLPVAVLATPAMKVSTVELLGVEHM